MTNPFPGMNPYLEQRRFWGGVHHRLITYVADALQTQLRPRYFVNRLCQLHLLPPKRGRPPKYHEAFILTIAFLQVRDRASFHLRPRP